MPLFALSVLAALLFCSGCEEGLEENLPVCTAGAPCDDNDENTVNDIYDAACLCSGAPDPCPGSGDRDGDGICADRDCDDEDAAVITVDEDGDGVCGDIDCDDSDPMNTDTDRDGDGFCSEEDCSDLAPNYYPGAPCDDGNPGTINDTVTPQCTCAGDYPYGTMTDPRDGQTYLTIEISGKTIMAENLNFETGSSWCFDEEPAHCETYGRLYNWQTALEACPEGWHLPANAEWDELINSLGGNLVAGGPMKATTAWDPPNAGATNNSGFTGLPGGCRTFSGLFSMAGETGFWWSATEANQGNNILTPSLTTTSSEVQRLGNHMGDGFSIRCFRD